jgi:hypothetical protein
MIEKITLLFATPIVKAVLDKFYEGVGSKLGEKAVELLPENVKQLGQLLWDKCLRGKSGTENLLEKAAKGSVDDQKRLADYLSKVLESDATLKQEVQKLVQKIHSEVTQNNIQSKNLMYVTEEAQGLQVNDPNQPVFQVQGDNTNIHFGSTGQKD